MNNSENLNTASAVAIAAANPLPSDWDATDASKHLNEQADKLREVEQEAKVAGERVTRSYAEAWITARDLGGPADPRVKSWVDEKGIPTPNSGSKYYPFAQRLIIGRSLQSIKKDRLSTYSALKSKCGLVALLFDALDAKCPGAAGVDEAMEVIGSNYAEFAIAYRKERSGNKETKDGDEGQQLTRSFMFERFASTELTIDEAAKLGSGGVFLVQVDGSKVRLIRASVPAEAEAQHVLPYVQGDVTKLDPALNSLGEMLWLGGMIPTGKSNEPLSPTGDRSSESEEFAPATSTAIVLADGRWSFAQARRVAGNVLVVKPKHLDLVNSCDRWVDPTQRKNTAALIAGEAGREAYQSTDPKKPSVSQLTKNGDTVLTVTHASTEKAQKLTIKQLSSFGSSPTLAMWTNTARFDEYRPSHKLAVEGDQLALLPDIIKFVRSKGVVSVGFDPDRLTFKRDRKAPLEVPASGSSFSKSEQVRVLAEDLHGPLEMIAQVSGVSSLRFRADARGLLEIAFETPWVEASLFVPTLMDKSEQRNPALLRRIERPRPVEQLALAA